MTIRVAKLPDARSIAEVHVAAWQTAYRGFLPDHILDNLSVYNSEQRWRRRLAQNTSQTHVAEKNGRLVGFVTLGPSRDDGADKALEGEIYAFYVDPSVWRQGYGQALCRQALESLRAQGFSEVILWVLHNNQRAISFYQAVGFQADGGVKTERWRNGIEIHESRYRQSLVGEGKETRAMNK